MIDWLNIRVKIRYIRFISLSFKTDHIHILLIREIYLLLPNAFELFKSIKPNIINLTELKVHMKLYLVFQNKKHLN